MSQDPFEQFERSRSGWLIPIALFIAGAIPTAVAIQSISRITTAEPVPEEQVEQAEEVPENLPRQEEDGNEEPEQGGDANE